MRLIKTPNASSGIDQLSSATKPARAAYDLPNQFPRTITRANAPEPGSAIQVPALSHGAWRGDIERSNPLAR